MTHPIVQKFLAGKNDAGGTIRALELEIERLQKRVAELEAAQLGEGADVCKSGGSHVVLAGSNKCMQCGKRVNRRR